MCSFIECGSGALGRLSAPVIGANESLLRVGVVWRVFYARGGGVGFCAPEGELTVP